MRMQVHELPLATTIFEIAFFVAPDKCAAAWVLRCCCRRC